MNRYKRKRSDKDRKRISGRYRKAEGTRLLI